MISFSLPLEVSITVPNGRRGSLARSVSRMDLRMLKVVLCEMDSARLYSAVRTRWPPSARSSHGAYAERAVSPASSRVISFAAAK